MVVILVVEGKVNKYLLDELNVGSILNHDFKSFNCWEEYHADKMSVSDLKVSTGAYNMNTLLVMQCLEFQVGVLLMEEIQYVALWLKDNRNYWRWDFSTWSWAQNQNLSLTWWYLKCITCKSLQSFCFQQWNRSSTAQYVSILKIQPNQADKKILSK